MRPLTHLLKTSYAKKILSYLPFVVLFSLTVLVIYGVYTPYKEKKKELKNTYEERKKVLEDYKRKAKELKTLLKDDESLNKNLEGLKDKAYFGGDGASISEKLKALMEEEAERYGLVAKSQFPPQTEDLQEVKKVKLKANYESTSIESILRFVESLESKGVMISYLKLGVDNPTSPGAYYIELEVYKVWIPQ
ncbi:MAG: hypothetical protein ACK4SM_03825 [Aquificaceae bacterium]